MVNYIAALAVVGFSLSASGQPQQPECVPITESVAQVRPKPFITARISEFLLAPLDKAAKEADLVLVGTLKRSGAYLSDDKCTLYTDYVVAPSRIVAGEASVGERPGPMPVAVRTWGGETTIDGVPVKIYDSNLVPLKEGPPYLLLLKFNKQAGKYEIYDHGAYALSINNDGRIRSVVQVRNLMDSALDDVPLEHAINAIKEHRSR